MSSFAAIDFETANYSRDSACAVGIVVVSDRRIVDQERFLIRPPSSNFRFTHIHGLTWRDVRSAPDFEGLWPRLRKLVRGIDFLAAHSAYFDRSVLRACCEVAEVKAPAVPFVCTVKLAREYLNIYPTTLPRVCRQLRISLEHHDPLSDAVACARIVLKAQRAGWDFSEWM